MKKLFLTGIAALFLATGTARAEISAKNARAKALDVASLA